MVVATGRHGDGWVSAPAQQAATACRPARLTLQIRCTHAQFQPSFCCAASLCDRGQLRMPVSFPAVLPRRSARSLRSASALLQREAPRTRRCTRVCAHVQCLSLPGALDHMILAPRSCLAACLCRMCFCFRRVSVVYVILINIDHFYNARATSVRSSAAGFVLRFQASIELYSCSLLGGS